MAKAELTKTKAAATKAVNAANRLYQGFLSRLADFRVLDPACGSGNFLYLALGALKDLEHQVMLEAEALGLQRGFPQVGPEAVRGIEVNPFAAELARVTVWIGEIQWMLRHGFNVSRNPILKPLDNIEKRDAVLNPDGTEPDWPAVDVIVGNPPFLGDKKMRGLLGEDYVGRLRRCYQGRVPGGADLVTYWFERARAQIEAGKARAAGLVATNSIRGGANRTVLERIQRVDPKPNLGASHGEDHLRHAATGGQIQSGGFPARAGGGPDPGDWRGAFGSGDEGRSGASPRPTAHRPDRAEIDDGGGPWQVTDSPALAIPGLMIPSGVKFGPDGNLYGASAYTSRILQYNASDNFSFRSAFGTRPNGGLELGFPNSLNPASGPPDFTVFVFGPDEAIYVASVRTDIDPLTGRPERDGSARKTGPCWTSRTGTARCCGSPVRPGPPSRSTRAGCSIR